MESMVIDEGGVPVFTPSYADFRDFREFVRRIEPVGMTSGIVKVIPPRQWLDALPQLDHNSLEGLRVRKPIAQVPEGGRGVFVVNNVEKRRGYSLAEWLKLCMQPHNQPPAPRGQAQHTLDRAETVCDYDDSAFSVEKCVELERVYWKTLGLGVGGAVSMYGADMPGSLFSDATSDWNVDNLDSPLKELDAKVPGVNAAYLYCGMWRATFAWHLEDMDLPSINYIHFGSPKQWYTVPQSHHERFYSVMTKLFPDEASKCPEFLRHKTFLVAPSVLEGFGIPIKRVVHRQHEFVITFPYGYHSGFNYGYNCAESVNFATDAWLDIGLKSCKCTCIDDSVGIDVYSLVEKITGVPLERPTIPVPLPLLKEPKRRRGRPSKRPNPDDLAEQLHPSLIPHSPHPIPEQVYVSAKHSYIDKYEQAEVVDETPDSQAKKPRIELPHLPPHKADQTKVGWRSESSPPMFREIAGIPLPPALLRPPL